MASLALHLHRHPLAAQHRALTCRLDTSGYGMSSNIGRCCPLMLETVHLRHAHRGVHDSCHDMLCVRASADRPMLGASFDELVASTTASTTASGGQSIIIFTGGGAALHPAGEKVHPSLRR